MPGPPSPSWPGEVGLSAPAVHERVGKLEAQGVITGYHAAVAPEALGYSMSALVGIFLSDTADDRTLADALPELPAIEDCWFVAGEESFVVKIRVPDIGRVGAGHPGAVDQIHGVARTRSTVVLSTRFEGRRPVGRPPAWLIGRPAVAHYIGLAGFRRRPLTRPEETSVCPVPATRAPQVPARP